MSWKLQISYTIIVPHNDCMMSKMVSKQQKIIGNLSLVQVNMGRCTYIGFYKCMLAKYNQILKVSVVTGFTERVLKNVFGIYS